MKVPNSPITGKPLRAVYEPDSETYRGEKYDFLYISFHDDAEGESYTTTESDTSWFNQLTNQYRAKHGIPYTDEIIALRERYGLSASKMSVILGKMGDTFQTKMNKVLFYIDFLSYRERGMAISGLAYNAIDFGPVPQRWDRVYSAFDEVEQQTQLVHDQEMHPFVMH